MMSEPAIKSSGNVFVDLGYSPDEAAILQMRADLMANLRKFIKARKLTQKSSRNAWCKPVENFRSCKRQVGKVQP